jgi:uncharacterized protein
MSDPTTEAVNVIHDPEKHRYEIRVGEALAGFTAYRLPDDQHVDFVHTEVDAAYNGLGLAARLVADALADVQARGTRVSNIADRTEYDLAPPRSVAGVQVLSPREVPLRGPRHDGTSHPAAPRAKLHRRLVLR